MKTIRSLYYTIAVFLLLSGCTTPKASHTLFQVSTISALEKGCYDGAIKFGELKQHGDFGIGTFENLDGEMIALDGNFYQVKSDGMTYPVSDSAKTPYSVVTFFEKDQSYSPMHGMEYKDILRYIDTILPTKNVFYAIKIDGFFDFVKTRSVPRQEKPFRPLAEVVKDQSEFKFYDVRGTLVGIYSPPYVKGVDVPGYHFHFIDREKKAGGHLLDAKSQYIKIEIDEIRDFSMALPKNSKSDSCKCLRHRPSM